MRDADRHRMELGETLPEEGRMGPPVRGRYAQGTGDRAYGRRQLRAPASRDVGHGELVQQVRQGRRVRCGECLEFQG